MASSTWCGDDDFNRNNVVEYKDLQASAMAVDCLGHYALLGGKRQLMFVDLNRPRERFKKIPRQSKWEVTSVQWNQHSSHVHLLAVASNQSVDICSWDSQQPVSLCNLKAHSRVVSDIDWSTFDVNVLATCSVDAYIHLWDIRDGKKPTVSFQTVAGASQVKWNKVTSNIVASSHEADVRLWDSRKGSSPTLYIAAHPSKIHGLDWSPHSEVHLATCSQDGTVKFWDVRNTRKAEGCITAVGHPVWRARYTPFGYGLITVVVPQLRRGENSLFLWDTRKLSSHIHTFVGHTDVVLEYAWRKASTDLQDYWLVTWSRDQTLRLWKIDQNLQKLCGHDLSNMDLSHPLLSEDMVTNETSKTTPQSHQNNFQREFDALKANLPPNVAIEQPIQMSGGWQQLLIRFHAPDKSDVVVGMDFPSDYPKSTVSIYQIEPKNFASQERVLQILTETAEENAKRSSPCLIECVKKFSSKLEEILMAETKSVQAKENTLPLSYNTYGSFQDSTIPFPRTSGARFCSAGYLVWFARPSNMKRVSGRDTDMTPRELAALSAFEFRSTRRQHVFSSIFDTITGSPPRVTSEPVSISSFFTFKKVKHKIRCRHRESSSKPNYFLDKQSKVGPVEIYDVSSLDPVHRQLGANYIMDKRDVKKTCEVNANAAADIGRDDLVQLWTLISHIYLCNSDTSHNHNLAMPWALHPFGKRLIKRLFDRYMSIYDVQTLAMLCCLLMSETDRGQILPGQDVILMTKNGSFSPSMEEVIKFGTPPVHIHKMNSLSEYDYDSCIIDEISDIKDEMTERHKSNSRLLDLDPCIQYDTIITKYADILRRWGLRNSSTLILKFVDNPQDIHKEIGFGIWCHFCHKKITDVHCNYCKSLAFQCIICHTRVIGASNFCLSCGHGGHSSHMSEWFRTRRECPSGCGCNCIDNSSRFL